MSPQIVWIELARLRSLQDRRHEQCGCLDVLSVHPVAVILQRQVDLLGPVRLDLIVWVELLLDDHLDRQLVSYSARNGAKLGSTKTARRSAPGSGSRRVPLPASAAAVLAPIVQDLDADALVFTTPAGVPLVRHRTVKIWNSLCADAGVSTARGRGWHELRHAYASHQIAAGVPVNVVAASLGHSVEVCLRTYGHLIPDTDQRLRAVADALISGRSPSENTL